MDVETKLHSNSIRAQELMSYPETQVFFYDLLLMKLIDDGDYKNVTVITFTNTLYIG